MSIGDALARARTQAGLTIAQVSQRTCIRETIVRGIERGDFSACGGDFYARGHIRSIARAVGLDPDELIREYDAAHEDQPEMTAADVFEPATPIKLKERRAPNWSVAMGAVLVAVLGYGVYRAVGASPAPSPPSHPAAAARGGTQAASGPTAAPPTRSSPSATPAPDPSVTRSRPSTAPPASRELVIQLVAAQDCWVEFTTPSGRYLQQYLVPQGTSKSWTFHRDVKMQIGNPGGIQLTVNGKKLGNPGVASPPVTLTLRPDKKLPATG